MTQIIPMFIIIFANLLALVIVILRSKLTLSVSKNTAKNSIIYYDYKTNALSGNSLVTYTSNTLNCFYLKIDDLTFDLRKRENGLLVKTENKISVDKNVVIYNDFLKCSNIMIGDTTFDFEEISDENLILTFDKNNNKFKLDKTLTIDHQIMSLALYDSKLNQLKPSKIRINKLMNNGFLYFDPNGAKENLKSTNLNFFQCNNIFLTKWCIGLIMNNEFNSLTLDNKIVKLDHNTIYPLSETKNKNLIVKLDDIDENTILITAKETMDWKDLNYNANDITEDDAFYLFASLSLITASQKFEEGDFLMYNTFNRINLTGKKINLFPDFNKAGNYLFIYPFVYYIKLAIAKNNFTRILQIESLNQEEGGEISHSPPWSKTSSKKKAYYKISDVDKQFLKINAREKYLQNNSLLVTDNVVTKTIKQSKVKFDFDPVDGDLVGLRSYDKVKDEYFLGNIENLFLKLVETDFDSSKNMFPRISNEKIKSSNVYFDKNDNEYCFTYDFRLNNTTIEFPDNLHENSKAFLKYDKNNNKIFFDFDENTPFPKNVLGFDKTNTFLRYKNDQYLFEPFTSIIFGREKTEPSVISSFEVCITDVYEFFLYFDITWPGLSGNDKFAVFELKFENTNDESTIFRCEQFISYFFTESISMGSIVELNAGVNIKVKLSTIKGDALINSNGTFFKINSLCV